MMPLNCNYQPCNRRRSLAMCEAGASEYARFNFVCLPVPLLCKVLYPDIFGKTFSGQAENMMNTADDGSNTAIGTFEFNSIE